MNDPTGITTAINNILLILGVLTALIVVILVLVAWSKWNNLGAGPRALVFVAIGLTILIVLLSAGVLAGEQLEAMGIPTSWDSLVTKASNVFLAIDGWTRANKWAGVLLLATIPFLLWSGDNDNSSVTTD